MANTLTGLIPTLYTSLDTVSRELVGLIPSARRDGRLERAALNQTVTSPITPTASSSTITPSMTIPEGDAQTIGNRTITISKSESVKIPWEGEEAKSLETGDTPQLSNIQKDQITQAFRDIANEVEADIAATYIEASNATGTAGTTPFASSLRDAAQVKKLLDDNGAPSSDRFLVVNTAAGANMRSLSNLNQANTAGTDQTLRDGILLNLFGMQVRESAQIADHTKGTASGAITDTAGYSIGDTTITLGSAGAGTIVAGDSVLFTGDTTQYVVTTGDSDVSDGGTIVLASPGLKAAIAATSTGITVAADYAANLAFPRTGMDLISRLPALPAGGDAAVDRIIMQDPFSGLVFDVAMYKGYHKAMLEIGMAWGQRISKPDHVVILLG